MNTLKQTLVASALTMSALTVQATPFYIDLDGTGVGNTFADVTNCATCTADANELTIKYQSHTAITLSAAPLAGPIPVITVGDDIVTTGGYSTDGFSVNAVTGLNPSGATYGFSNTAFAGSDDWGLTYDFNLIGDVASVNPDGSIGDVTYSSGTIEMLFTKFDGLGAVASTELAFTMNVTGSDLDNNSNLLIFGELDFTGAVATYADLFNIQGGQSCAGDISFDGLASCVPAMDFTFVIDQNLNAPAFEGYDAGTNVLTVGGNHDGSLTFNVPEPSTLFLFGVSLLGLAGKVRRRS